MGLGFRPEHAGLIYSYSFRGLHDWNRALGNILVYLYIYISVLIYIWYPPRVIHQFWCKYCVFP